MLCACTCTTPNLHQPVLYHTSEVLPNLPHFAVWVVATMQTSSAINIRSTCVAWKKWTKNSKYTLTFFLSSSISMGGTGTTIMRLYMYMNYGVIIIKPSQTLPKTHMPPTTPPTTCIPTYHHHHGKDLFTCKLM